MSGSEAEFEKLIGNDTYEPLADSLGFKVFEVLRALTRTTGEGFVGDGPRPPKKEPEHRVAGWWSNFRHEEYNYKLRSTDPLSGPTTLDCTIIIPTEMMSGCDEVFVKIELLAKGCSHENMYATSAGLEDPARRLAFGANWSRDSITPE